MPSTKRLNPMEIIAEVQDLRGEIEHRAARIFELSDILYTSVRHGHFRQERERLQADIQLLDSRLSRATSHEEPHETLRQIQAALDGAQYQLALHEGAVPVYTMFANAWKRFAGSMHAGIRRTASIDRLVAQLQQRQGVTEAAQGGTRQSPPTPTPEGSVEELVELYGEAVTNASE
jgi:hypothetical protein